MEKDVFIEGIKDILEIDDEIDASSPVVINSLETLSIIAYIDQHFEKQLKAADLKQASTVYMLMELIGLDNFTS